MRLLAALCLVCLTASIAGAWSSFGLSSIGAGAGNLAPILSAYNLQVTTNPGAIYYWRENELSGTVANETMAMVNQGTYIGSPTLGMLGPPRTGDRAVLYNGTTQYIQTTTQLTNPGATGYSLERWFKTNGALTCPIVNAMPLIQFNTTQAASSTNYDRNLYMGTDCRIYFAQFQTAIVSVSSPLTYADGNWHYAVGVWDGPAPADTNMLLYIDGNLVAGPVASPGPQNFTGFWNIGIGFLSGWPATTAVTSFWNGFAGEAAIYNIALTPVQVFQHFTGNPPALTSIATTCVPASIGVNATSQCTARGTYSNGGSQDISSACAWISLQPSIATINAITGLATGKANGTATERCTDP